MIFLALLFLPSQASGQSLPKIRMAYTSIAIQFTPVYLMKEFDLRRKQGLDLEILMIPVISRAVQAAFAGELHFIPAAVSLTSTPIWLLRDVVKEVGACSEVQPRPKNRDAEFSVHDPDGNAIELVCSRKMARIEVALGY